MMVNAGNIRLRRKYLTLEARPLRRPARFRLTPLKGKVHVAVNAKHLCGRRICVSNFQGENAPLPFDGVKGP
jgi:hypothetical protein